jgi:hypothetical protein
VLSDPGSTPGASTTYLFYRYGRYGLAITRSVGTAHAARSTRIPVSEAISRIRAGQLAELIARNIPSAASMCYDAGANQFVIPMNPNNRLAFVRLVRLEPNTNPQQPTTGAARAHKLPVSLVACRSPVDLNQAVALPL